ncbi:MAG: hypothetical protein DI549_09190 [Ancylobacter novellus]|uniref:ABM domain-containing protein n=1 Tax=Ancylobacter novellus TaxID=921 RepID=A0A2W5R2L9_ANCNO|nr:MAG: hypothetical protein DI549_09190 [Ancylobacter novellus]
MPCPPSRLRFDKGELDVHPIIPSQSTSVACGAAFRQAPERAGRRAHHRPVCTGSVILSYVVWVEFHVAEEDLGSFMMLVKSNAAESVRAEAGCQRFDVLVPVEGEGAIALYEIYDSEAAFRDHLSTPHFLEFDALTGPLIKHKTVRSYVCHQNSK